MRTWFESLSAIERDSLVVVVAALSAGGALVIAVTVGLPS